METKHAIYVKTPWVKNEVKEEIRKYFHKSENWNTTLQNLWDAAKVILRGKFIIIQVFLKKPKTSLLP